MKGLRDGRMSGLKGQDSTYTLLSWQKNPFLGSALPRAHSGHSPKALHARTAAEKTPANAPASVWGGKWANPAEQTTAQGFAFVFTALNEAVSLLGSG